MNWMWWIILFALVLFVFKVVSGLRWGLRSFKILHVDLVDALKNDFAGFQKYIHDKYHEQQALLQYRLIRFVQEEKSKFNDTELFTAIEKAIEEREYNYHFISGITIRKLVNPPLRFVQNKTRIIIYLDKDQEYELDLPDDISADITELYEAVSFWQISWCDSCH